MPKALVLITTPPPAAQMDAFPGVRLLRRIPAMLRGHINTPDIVAFQGQHMLRGGLDCSLPFLPASLERCRMGFEIETVGFVRFLEFFAGRYAGGVGTFVLPSTYFARVDEFIRHLCGDSVPPSAPVDRSTGVIALWLSPMCGLVKVVPLRTLTDVEHMLDHVNPTRDAEEAAKLRAAARAEDQLVLPTVDREGCSIGPPRTQLADSGVTPISELVRTKPQVLASYRRQVRRTDCLDPLNDETPRVRPREAQVVAK